MGYNIILYNQDASLQIGPVKPAYEAKYFNTEKRKF